jgi:hypothetical protein
VHIGLNRVDDTAYRGLLPPLAACEQDARSMRDLAASMGYSSRLLVGDDASCAVVRDCLESTIERLTEGDALFLSFAGHMTSLRGVGDDPDGWDEAWCLRDGVLLDDLLHELLADVPAGADVLVVTDSCFADGITDTDGEPAGRAGARVSPTGVRPRAPSVRNGDRRLSELVRQGAIPVLTAPDGRPRRPILARGVSLAAATEGELAFEGEEHGYFTAALLEALRAAPAVVPREASLTWGDILETTGARLHLQTPVLRTFGSAGPNLIALPAFSRRTP